MSKKVKKINIINNAFRNKVNFTITYSYLLILDL